MPKGRREKITTAIIVDDDHLSQKGGEAEEMGQVEEHGVARKAARGQSAVSGGGSQNLNLLTSVR